MMLFVLYVEEEPLKRSIDSDNDSEDEAASAVNPLSSDAAHIHPLLQNLLLNNDIQRSEESKCSARRTDTALDEEQ
ncbi:hypothetical protein Bca4012_005096 [Brassica carinata]